MPNISLNLNPKVAAKGASIFDAATIDRRLAVLRAKPDKPEVQSEIAYLEALKARKFPE